MFTSYIHAIWHDLLLLLSRGKVPLHCILNLVLHCNLHGTKEWSRGNVCQFQALASLSLELYGHHMSNSRPACWERADWWALTGPAVSQSPDTRMRPFQTEDHSHVGEASWDQQPSAYTQSPGLKMLQCFRSLCLQWFITQKQLTDIAFKLLCFQQG